MKRKKEIEEIKEKNENLRNSIEKLKRINVDSSFSNRKKIAIANGIADYKGLNYQNLKLCNLLKKGELIKPQV